jgi:hypothetical protein
MGVERRHIKRVEIGFSVGIRYRGHRALPARAVNLSAEGMYLSTQRLRIPKGTLVHLEFRTLEREWDIDSLVIHAGPDGLGVMFVEPQPDLMLVCRRDTLRPPLVAGL